MHRFYPQLQFLLYYGIFPSYFQKRDNMIINTNGVQPFSNGQTPYIYECFSVKGGLIDLSKYK
jgi:hypothetical protein